MSLFEPLFRLCIPNVTIFDLLGISRERVGNDFTDAAPRSLYQTEEGRWLGPLGHIPKHLRGAGPGHGHAPNCSTTPVSRTTRPGWKTATP